MTVYISHSAIIIYWYYIINVLKFFLLKINCKYKILNVIYNDPLYYIVCHA